jgi:SAM-dependent MidA family methyltransferase
MLPPLDAAEQRHCAAVSQAVRAAVAAHGGWLAFDDYLRIVLYSPGLGYYSAGSVKLGAAGDFVTAPELSELFGRCLARQCAQVLQACGGDVLELGAGTGALAESVLPALQQLGVLPGHYFILEVSADLRARAQQRLGRLPARLRERVHWLDAMPPTPVCGVILANEVADALPFKRFVIDGGALFERGVALSAHGEMICADRPAGAALRAQVDHIVATLAPLAAGASPRVAELADGDAGWPWPAGFQSELCPLLQPWIAAISAALARGAAFIVDYGLARHEYYHPQRASGTLRCHFRHRVHDDPLRYPGLQDISAWVEFTRLAEAAVEAQLQVACYCTQAAFLLANGIESEMAVAASPLEQARLASQARQLLLPGEMGESFKVMGLTRELDVPLRAAAFQDLRRSL